MRPSSPVHDHVRDYTPTTLVVLQHTYWVGFTCTLKHRKSIFFNIPTLTRRPTEHIKRASSPVRDHVRDYTPISLPWIINNPPTSLHLSYLGDRQQTAVVILQQTDWARLTSTLKHRKSVFINIPTSTRGLTVHVLRKYSQGDVRTLNCG